jgi:hypothetical protein
MMTSENLAPKRLNTLPSGLAPLDNSIPVIDAGEEICFLSAGSDGVDVVVVMGGDEGVECGCAVGDGEEVVCEGGDSGCCGGLGDGVGGCEEGEEKEGNEEEG